MGKKATLQARRVIHACRKESLFFFANKLDNVLVQITLVVVWMGLRWIEMEVAGTLFPPIFGLKLPVVKAKVPVQNRHVGKAVSHLCP